MKKEKSQEPEYKAEIVVLDKPYLKITGKIKESEEEFRISKSCNLKIREVTEWTTDCHKSSFGGYLGYTLAASISGAIGGDIVGALLATDDAGEGAKTFLITFSLATGAGLLYDGAVAIFCPRKIVSSSKKARRAMPRDKQRAHQQKCYS